MIADMSNKIPIIDNPIYCIADSMGDGVIRSPGAESGDGHPHKTLSRRYRLNDIS